MITQTALWVKIDPCGSSSVNCMVADVVTDGISILCWPKIKYLALYKILSKGVFKCYPLCAKVKYFRNLNGILAKIGLPTYGSV